jgi:hypothetical protein
MSMNIYEIVKGIYKKQPLEVDKIDVSLCIALTNILRLDLNNLEVLKKLTNYLFFIEPKRFLMLLFIKIPQRLTPPFLKGVSKLKDEKENKDYEKIAYRFNWSKKELLINTQILNKLL